MQTPPYGGVFFAPAAGGLRPCLQIRHAMEQSDAV